MKVEQYTCVLLHEFVDGDNKFQIEEPIVMKMCSDRTFGCEAIDIHRMLDRFTHEVLQRSIPNG